MADLGGTYQQLLLCQADNGHLAARPSSRPPEGRHPHRRRNGDRGPLGQELAPVAGPFRALPAGAPGLPGTLRPPLPSGTLYQAPAIPPTWGLRNSVTINLRAVPPNATTWDIRQFFKRFGRVVWVELDPSQGALRSGKVRFEPPPTDSSFFRDGKCYIDIDGVTCPVIVEFPRQRSDELTLTTPLGNTCPASLVLRPEKLTFGILPQPTAFMPKKEVISLGRDLELQLTVDLRRKKFTIHFPLFVGRELQCYRIDIKFGIIKSIHWTTTDKSCSSLLIRVDGPPLFRKKQDRADGDAWADRLIWGEDELWNRVVDIKPSSQAPKTEPVSLDQEPGMIDLGRWTTYWIDLSNSTRTQWSVMETHLCDWNIATKADVDFTQVPDEKPGLWSMLADQLTPTESENGPSWDNDLSLLSQTAHLEVCLSHDIFCEHNITREFLEKLLGLSETPSNFGINRARLVLEYAADQGQPVHNPMNLFQDKDAMTYYPATLHIPDYCALVRKVTVTPTRIYFNTPTVETTNRIVRHYKLIKDFFIRVQFIDELLDGRIRACEVDRDDELYTRVYRVMLRGIRMGRWHWKFLAFGNSQIRESGAFFFCEPEDQVVTCDSIRQWMGDFSHISSVAKFAARLGQCFSTTRLLHSIPTPHILEIPDVEKDGFCFTDGVGKISQTLAGLVADDWKIFPPPSAFQFRMGGCKGVLVTWPEPKGTEVWVRPSQRKFSAKYNRLEIIRCSQFSCATLNRQTISILSCLGVPDEVFTDMMAVQISNYNTAMTDMPKAVELLNSYVDENMTTATIALLVENGFMHTREPFVRTVLQLWRSWSIKALKEKAKLIVDQGAFLLGCVDETGTLRGHSKATEGRRKIPDDKLPQIFVQVPDPKDRGAYRVITGLCLVGRNPSLHPGDIRVVQAVDVPELRRLRDVVVFPLNGDQDVPSMCSGGDLDGDDFFVIWDPKLLPPEREWGHSPMNYSAPMPLVEPGASMAKSLASFFVLFMKNDRLPLIAHAHLATADHEPEGAKHSKCLKLAELHSTAVDYVKTGIPAAWDKKLDPRKYPHFMEKSRGKTYHSNTVLGKLYDMVGKEDFDNGQNYMLPFDDRVLKQYKLDNALLKEARKIKTQYDIAMRRAMGQLEIRTEFEVWTAFVLSKPRVGSDYKVQEKVGGEAAGLKKQFRDLCTAVIEKHQLNKLEFVAAMYTVTWEEMQIALYEARKPHLLPNGTVGLRRVTARSMPLISFPWLFPREMCLIAGEAEKVAELVGKPLVKPEPNGAGRAEPELELAGMDSTRTNDGQVIHRGETLRLFRHHSGDDEEGFYCNEVMLDSEPAQDATAGGERASQAPPAGSPILKISQQTAHASKGSSILDLLSLEDPFPSIDWSAARLTTDKEPAQPAPAADGGSEASRANSQQNEDGETKNGEDSEEPRKPATESVFSDSNTSWDRVASPGLESSAEWEPVEYISLLANGLALGGPRLNASDLSGPVPAPLLNVGDGEMLGLNLAGGAVAGANWDQEVRESDSEVEYEEEIIEFEAETVMEQAARFA
ncbi:RNA dependent RNA polymerase-domain-containing protein [Staphylotrichum tortipilum]|uniref:RNA dependent RNA polymerase-domain-containing protein n=1 Tax=Staphylotrichum tortipilum TaxID=2831512 RepID=A0AAN6RY94_9PEZI|nr:RNA dependent RNA polymerase-domain-containing protein [Staphylotrichum longicolle]